MEIPKEVVEYLQDNAGFIQRGDFKVLYNGIPSMWMTSYITHIFIASGIDPLKDLKVLPRGFYNDLDIQSVHLPDHMQEIGSAAFMDCDRLSSVHLPANLTSLGSRAFKGCTALSQIKLPQGIKILPNDVFEGCSTLHSVNLPEGLEEIRDNAFDRCYNLQSINLPTTLKRIHMQAFVYAGLKSITFDCRNVEISSYAFESCSNLSSIYLPSGDWIIHKRAFSDGASQRIITLGNKLGQIHVKAFAQEEAQEIHYEGTTDEWISQHPVTDIGVETIQCLDGEVERVDGYLWRKL